MAEHRYWRLLITAIRGPASQISGSLAELELRGTTGGPDLTSPTLAPTRAFASSTWDGSNPESPANAFDDLIGSSNMWSAKEFQPLPQWIGWDFQDTPQDIQEVAITARPSFLDAMVRDGQIQWSDDNATWTTAFSFANATWTVAGQTQTFSAPDPNAHRYWRITIQPQQWIGFAELELRFNAIDQTGSGTATASSQYSNTYSALRAVDNNTATWWSTTQNAGVSWWQYDFGANPKDIQDIVFMEIDAVRVPKNFTVSHSDDGTTWTSWQPATITTPVANEYYFVDANGLKDPNGSAGFHRVTKTGVELLYNGNINYRATKSGVEVIVSKARPRSTKTGVEVLVSKSRPRVTKTGVEILVSSRNKYDKIAARAAALGIKTYIELIEIDGTEFGGHVFRLTPNHVSTGPIRFRGQEFMPAPIETEGFAFDMAGEFAQPTLTIGDPTGMLAAEARLYRHCKLFRVRRWITDYAYCDDQEIGTGDAFGPEEYYISAMADQVSGSHITFTLDNIFVIRKMKLPSRKMFRRHSNPDLAFPGIGVTSV